jgi:HK97 family phage portal protein
MYFRRTALDMRLPTLDDIQTYGYIYRKQPNVRMVVSFLARNIAQLKLKVYQKNGNDRKELPDHPLGLLMANPSPTVTAYRTMYGVVADYALYDAAYLLKVTDQETGDKALIRLPPEMVDPGGENWYTPEYFTFYGTSKPQKFDANQVVYFRGYSPEGDLGGSSSIEALRQELAEGYQASRYREQLWKNGARMSGYIERPVDAPKWEDKKFQRFKASWQAQYAGDGPQAGGTPILEDGMVYKPAAMSAEQAQYIESRKLTREEVANAYHIPPPMVGILDHATFSNIEEQHKMLYQDTLGPWLTQIEQEINLQLLPEMEERPNVARKLYVEFNIAEKLEGSFEEQSSALSTLVGGPVMTRNEGRAKLNLPSVDGGDELVTPLNVTTGGQNSPQDGGDPTPTPDPQGASTDATAPPKAFLARMKQVTLSKFGAGVTEWFQVDRWTKELATEIGEQEAKAYVRVVKSGLDAAAQKENPKDAIKAVFDVLECGT